MDHSQVNKHVAVCSNLHSELANALCHLHVCIHAHIWDAVQSGSKGHDHQTTWLCCRKGTIAILKRQRPPSLAFGAIRYCSPLKDMSGQIGAFKMPALTDKVRGEQLAQHWMFSVLKACQFVTHKILLPVPQAELLQEQE